MSNSAERAARTLLTRYGIETPPIPVDDIAAKVGLPVTYHDLEDGVSGMLIRQDDHAVAAINVNHHEHRQRFTIAHELAHFLMHHDSPSVFVDDLLVHFRAEKSSKRFDPREREANAFAAALLMPTALLREDLKGRPIDISDDEAVRALADRYKVSAQALTIRLMSLGLVAEFEST
jgi:Zn-dependent peptidase ImmA (M78 family)